MGKRRACRVMLLGRNSWYYRSRKDEEAALRMRIKEIAAVRVRYGYLRIHVLLRLEGWRINKKRVYRLYREEGLNLRAKRPRRRVSAAPRVGRPEITGLNECWSMDLGSDTLADGLAAKHVIELKGGLAAAAGGQVLADLPLPIAGLLSPASLNEVAAVLGRLQAAYRYLGGELHAPSWPSPSWPCR